ncbi:MULTISPECIES: DUF2827 family protein [Paraburkholderia]|uniref:DUF2827 family protein n=1 Tax=Paraburkholderia TaxID=1822464 RepID=UPI0013A6C4C0|nr:MULTISPECIES: DUF2827 family protein [Paraburkholderia]MDH6147496.1 hypothetical protein [Paraburkholderia sp. WSM4179]
MKPGGAGARSRDTRRLCSIRLSPPNVCIVKTGFIPLLRCEAAHRIEPDLLEHVSAYNTFYLAEFIALMNQLDIVNED